jgi:hypothetical protein
MFRAKRLAQSSWSAVKTCPERRNFAALDLNSAI